MCNYNKIITYEYFGRTKMVTQKRIEDYGIKIGRLKKGKLNKITDVKGVKVGHCTIDTAENKLG